MTFMRNIKRAALLATGLSLLYFLSIGPVYGLAARGYIKATAEGHDAWARWQAFYSPMIALADSPLPFGRIMYGYIRLWQPDRSTENE